MPRQNRVAPFGDLIATPARGTLMGNRGCLHNGRQQIIRPYQSKRWIICQLEFKNRHRAIMSPGQYTELFFLDEATALAAGHRPCAECSRSRFESFRALWAKANPKFARNSKPLATVIDEALHHERIDALGRKRTYSQRLGEVPDGCFVLLPNDEHVHLVLQGFLHVWSAEGYHRHLKLQRDLVVRVLTPPSIVKTLALGYQVAIHPSVYQD